MMKKIFSLILSVTFLLCGMSVNSLGYAAAENKSHDVLLLQGLDIVCGFDYTTDINSPIRKSSFINYALNIIEGGRYTLSYNTDALYEAQQLGMIASAADVKKTDVLSGNEAAKIIMCLLGYQIPAEKSGGYPSGFVMMGMQERVLKGVDLVEKMTYASAFHILVNALDADHSNYIGTGNGNGNYLVSDNKVNALEYFRSIKRKVGIVTATYESGLYTTRGTNSGYIEVDDEEFLAGETDTSELLGHKVEVYYKTAHNSDKEIVYTDDLSAVDVITIDAEDIKAVKNNCHTIEYYRGKDSERTINVRISHGAPYLLNSTAYADCTASDLMKDRTKLVLTKTDGDSEYDVLNIITYDVMLLSSAAVAGRKLHNQYTFDDKLDVLDLSEYKDENVLIYRDGVKSEFSGLMPGDVISVYKTPKGIDGIIRIYADSSSFNGNVDMYSESDKEIKIGDKTYELSELYYSASAAGDKNAAPMKPGQSYTFRTDRDGKIVAAEKISTDEVTYGYVTKYAVKNNPFDKEIVLRVFMIDGTWECVTLAEFIKHNGEGKFDAEDVLSNNDIISSIPGVVGFRLNSEGKICELQTPILYRDGISPDLLNKTPTETHAYRGESHTFENYYYLTDRTIVFIVPNDGSTDEEHYKIGSKWSFEWDRSYTFTGYNRDEYSYLDMLVNERSVSDLNDASGLCVVKNIGQGIGADGGIVSTVTVGNSNYVGVSYEAEDSSVFANVSTGDIIKMISNPKGDVKSCEIVYSPKSGIIKNSGTDASRHNYDVAVSGKILKSNAPEEKILIESDKTFAFPFAKTNKVFTYDVKRGKMSVGDIKDFEIGDYVVLGLSRSNPTIAVIYKNIQ